MYPVLPDTSVLLHSWIIDVILSLDAVSICQVI